MNTITRIYTLIDPRDCKVFYVGRTTQALCQRIHKHLRDGRKQVTPKGVHIFKILEAGLKPTIHEIAILVNATPDEIHATEQAWIDFYRLSCKLTNVGMGKHGGCGNNKRIVWTPELLARLGKERDEAIAKEVGCERKTVSYQRQKLGIPHLPIVYKSVPPPMGGWIDTQLDDWVIDALGTMPDYKLAAMIGKCKTVIARERRTRGISSYAEQTGNNGQFKKGQQAFLDGRNRKKVRK